MTALIIRRRPRPVVHRDVKPENVRVQRGWVDLEDSVRAEFRRYGKTDATIAPIGTVES